MKKKKLGLILLITPIAIVIIILTLLFFIEIPDFIFDMFSFIYFFASPISIGIGIYLLIKHRDKDKKLFNSDVSEKRKKIDKIVLYGLVCPLLLLTIFFIFQPAIEKHIKTNYCKQCPMATPDTNVLGEEDEILEPTLLGSYELKADEYIWEWDMYEQGYFSIEPYLDIPRRYIFGDTVKVERSWDLKGGYPLDISCNEVDLTTEEMGNIHKCSLSYNNELITEDVRHEVYCFYEPGRNCIYNIGVVVFSNSYSNGNTEHLITMKYNGQSHNDITVYHLEDGKYRPLPFKYEKDGEYFSDLSYLVSGTTFEIYGVSKYGIFDKFIDSGMELATYFSEPTMGIGNNVKGIHSLWKVEDDGLYLRKTVMELYREEELQD